MRVPIPNFTHLPDRWTAADGRAVLDALDASGLPLSEFADRTGFQARRLLLWRQRLAATALPIRVHSEFTVEPVRLVEVVARPEVSIDPDPAPPEPSATAFIGVVSPDGWQLRVPRALLRDLVFALSAGSC